MVDQPAVAAKAKAPPETPSQLDASLGYLDLTDRAGPRGPHVDVPRTAGVPASADHAPLE